MILLHNTFLIAANTMCNSRWVGLTLLLLLLLLLLPLNTEHRHLARNPFICDCNLRWLADYLHKNPIETSGARCDAPKRMHRRRIEALRDEKFKCKFHSLQFIRSFVRFMCARCARCLRPDVPTPFNFYCEFRVSGCCIFQSDRPYAKQK